eukprot:UN09719
MQNIDSVVQLIKIIMSAPRPKPTFKPGYNNSSNRPPQSEQEKYIHEFQNLLALVL